MEGFLAPTTPAAKLAVPRCRPTVSGGVEAEEEKNAAADSGSTIDLNKVPSELCLDDLSDLFRKELLDEIRGTEVADETAYEQTPSVAADQTRSCSEGKSSVTEAAVADQTRNCSVTEAAVADQTRNCSVTEAAAAGQTEGNFSSVTEAVADQTRNCQTEGFVLNKEKHESVVFTSTGTYSSLHSDGKSISREEVCSMKRKNIYESIQTEGKKPKKRRPWPKIDDRSVAKKSVRTKTPEKKILTPKGRTPKKVRNEKGDAKPRIGKVQNGDKIREVPLTCKRALNFTTYCEKSEITIDHPCEELEKELTASSLKIAESKECPEPARFIVYKRRLKEKDCEGNSRKFGPNFPKICKKARTMKRKSRTISSFLIKVKKTTMRNRATALKSSPCLASLLPIIIQKKKRSNRLIRKRFTVMDAMQERRDRCKLARLVRKKKIEEQRHARGSGLHKRFPATVVKQDGFSFRGLSDKIMVPSALIGEQCEVPLVRDELIPLNQGTKEGSNASFEKTENLYTRGIEHIPHSGGFDLDGEITLNRRECDVERNLVPSDQNAVVLVKPKIAKSKNKAIVLVKPKTAKSKKPKPEVDVDPETMRVWKLQLVNHDYKVEDDGDAQKEKYWEQERNLFSGRTNKFVNKMHDVLGDRHFSPWRGSVLDSVVGVFLTQNASDNLSSSAFLRLAARFPLKPTAHYQRKSIEGEKIACSPTPVGNDIGNSSGCGIENADLISNENLVDSPNLDKAEVLQQEFSNILVNSIDTDAVLNNSHVHQDCSSKDELELTLGPCSITEHPPSLQSKSQKKNESPKKKKTAAKKRADPINWDFLRKTYGGNTSKATNDTMDCADWEAVMRASIDEVAEAIKERGQHFILAERIKACLARIAKDHGSLDLEWLRNVPEDKAKEYLLDIEGLGLKSVECLRLLSLYHHAFPVDTNVGRVAVRLGWVPLLSLPDSLQLHLLEQYPVLDKIQVYLWPRLRHLDRSTLFSLHYHMITFGKVFCTKNKPNCHACPLKGECKHYASLEASARPALPRPERPHEKHWGNYKTLLPVSLPSTFSDKETLSFLEDIISPEYQTKPDEPIVELAESDDEEYSANGEHLETDIEDLAPNPYRHDGIDYHLNISSMLKTMVPHYGSVSAPKWKEINRLRTTLRVYELPDNHPLLQALQLEKRDPKDLCPYLLVPWFSGESSNNDQNQNQGYGTVPASILIPLRTATRGAFPLSGTYFQVNEVFADYETSKNPLNFPIEYLCDLQAKRDVFCGAVVSALFKGMSLKQIMDCFGKGSICIRAFNRKTREPSVLSDRYHVSTTFKGKKSTTPPKVDKKAAEVSN